MISYISIIIVSHLQCSYLNFPLSSSYVLCSTHLKIKICNENIKCQELYAFLNR